MGGGEKAGPLGRKEGACPSGWQSGLFLVFSLCLKLVLIEEGSGCALGPASWEEERGQGQHDAHGVLRGRSLPRLSCQ